MIKTMIERSVKYNEYKDRSAKYEECQEKSRKDKEYSYVQDWAEGDTADLLEYQKEKQDYNTEYGATQYQVHTSDSILTKKYKCLIKNLSLKIA